MLQCAELLPRSCGAVTALQWPCCPTVGELVSLGVAAQPADGQVSRLLHDVPQLPREGELALPVHPARFHKHDLASQRGPGQAYGHSWLIEALRHLKGNTGRSSGSSHKKDHKNNSIVGFETTAPIETQKLSQVSDLLFFNLLFSAAVVLDMCKY